MMFPRVSVFGVNAPLSLNVKGVFVSKDMDTRGVVNVEEVLGGEVEFNQLITFVYH